MIETTSYYAYGVRALVVHGSKFAGRTNSTSFRDQCYPDFTATKKRTNTKLLFNQWVASFTYDKVTTSGRMLDTRGQSNKFPNETHMAVHQVHVYPKTKYNDPCVENTYDQEQTAISPDGMRRYEDIGMGSLTLGQGTFVNYKLILVGKHPGTTGEREKEYSRLSKIVSYLIDIESKFHVPESNVDPEKYL